jgi:hypothetical protein
MLQLPLLSPLFLSADIRVYLYYVYSVAALTNGTTTSHKLGRLDRIFFIIIFILFIIFSPTPDVLWCQRDSSLLSQVGV